VGARTKLKIAVFAPMPTASVSIANRREGRIFQQHADGVFQVIHARDLRFKIGARAKHQNPNTKLQRNPKLQTPKRPSIPPH